MRRRNASGDYRCSRCEKFKPSSDYYVHKTQSGVRANCKRCLSEIRKSSPRTLRKERKHHVETTYGISWREYKAMHKAQRKRCAICRTRISLYASSRWPTAAIDHCHDTGKVRALLCVPCNSGLGSFLDDAGLLRKAWVYMRQHSVA